MSNPSPGAGHSVNCILIVDENVIVIPDETLIVLPFEIVIVSVLVKLIDSPEVKVMVSVCKGCSPMVVDLGCWLEAVLAVIGAIELVSSRTMKSAATTLMLISLFPLIFSSPFLLYLDIQEYIRVL